MTWTQVYNPLNNIWLSALIALIPIIFFFIALTLLKLKGHIAAGITVLLSMIIAIYFYDMPASMVLGATGYGFCMHFGPSAILLSARCSYTS